MLGMPDWAGMDANPGAPDVFVDLMNAKRKIEEAQQMRLLYGDDTMDTPPLWMYQAVADIRYKPGWSFEIDSVSRVNGLGVILVKAMLPNSRSEKHEPIRIGGGIIIPRVFRAPEVGLDEFLKWFKLEVINSIEEHETDEWFMYKGRLVDDPHDRVKGRRPWYL